MNNTNRRWQNHLMSKGPVAFFLDRLQAHALSSGWQFEHGSFYFPMENPARDDALTRAYFELTEAFPYEIYLELTNACNLDCVMCARRAMTRPVGYMSDALFQRLIHEIVEMQPFACVHFYGIGESMLDPAVFTRLRYAHECGLQNTILFTNGTLLLERNNYRELAECGLATIGVDMDGFTAETCAAMRPSLDFFHLRKGIEALAACIHSKSLRTRLELAYHLYPGLNDKDIEPFAAWCQSNGLEYKIVTLHNWAGLRNDLPVSSMEGLIDVHHGNRLCPCASLWSCFTVAWDGRVGICFLDADIQDVLGNVADKSIQAVWQGPHLERRRQHVAGEYSGLCAQCDAATSVQLPPPGSNLYPPYLHQGCSGSDNGNTI